mmetsp:Transcript_15485/g.27161  ORF Transcript_15485/g.27161 Transcript_15485/m.27161 type:complete len:101 (-) Transcript_15485:218-520(-)
MRPPSSGGRVAGAVRRWATAMRGHAGQLMADIRQTPVRDVAKELAPRRLWKEFRQTSMHTQALCALTGYSLVATGLIYVYLRYSQAERRKQWGQVVSSWQ